MKQTSKYYEKYFTKRQGLLLEFLFLFYFLFDDGRFPLYFSSFKCSIPFTLYIWRIQYFLETCLSPTRFRFSLVTFYVLYSTMPFWIVCFTSCYHVFPSFFGRIPQIFSYFDSLGQSPCFLFSLFYLLDRGSLVHQIDGKGSLISIISNNTLSLEYFSLSRLWFGWCGRRRRGKSQHNTLGSHRRERRLFVLISCSFFPGILQVGVRTHFLISIHPFGCGQPASQPYVRFAPHVFINEVNVYRLPNYAKNIPYLLTLPWLISLALAML